MISREKVRIISLIISGSSQRGDFTSWTSEGGSTYFYEVKQAASGSTHSVCTGRATSCSNTLRRQIASCVVHDFCRKSVSAIEMQQVAKNQIRPESDNLCDFLRRQNSVAETKILTKILQYTQSDLSLQRVAATCCFNLSPSMYRPSLKLQMGENFIILPNLFWLIRFTT